jgi:hypothetical protein
MLYRETGFGIGRSQPHRAIAMTVTINPTVVQNRALGPSESRIRRDSRAGILQQYELGTTSSNLISTLDFEIQAIKN